MRKRVSFLRDCLDSMIEYNQARERFDKEYHAKLAFSKPEYAEKYRQNLHILTPLREKQSFQTLSLIGCLTILIRERGSEHCIHRIREVEVKSDEQYVCNSRRNLELKEIEICYVCMRLGGFKHPFADTDKFHSLPKLYTYIFCIFFFRLLPPVK